MNNSTIKRIYRALPSANCKGLCTAACGPVIFSKAEADRMRQKGLKPPTFGADHVCTALKGGRCSIYDHRPYVCRIFGAAEGLLCTFGCKPDRVISSEEVSRDLDALGTIDAEAMAKIMEIRT